MLRQVLTYDLCKHETLLTHRRERSPRRDASTDERLEAKDMDEGRRYLKEKTDA